MTGVMATVIERNTEVLSLARERLGADLDLPVPRTYTDVADGLNAFYFRDECGGYERPNIADRVRALSRLPIQSTAQQQEKIALEFINGAQALDTLFNNGNRLGLISGPTAKRTDMLSLQGFAAHELDVQLGKVITGMARRRAEHDPSPEAWLTVSVAALDTQIALYRAQASAESYMAGEYRFTKLRRGIAPYVMNLVKG